jgi:hypothetical protein
LPPGHEAISASAGSGKTFQLAHRYIRLLAAGVEPDRIAALTFSRKAAREIFDSIVGYLCDAAGSREAAATTSRRLGVPELPPDDYVAMLRRLLNMLNRLHIGTLDSFTVGVLRSFPFELGIPPAISLMGSGSAEALEVQQQALSSLFHVSSAGEGTAAGLLDAFTRASFGRSEKKIEARFVEFINGYHSFSASCRRHPRGASRTSSAGGKPWPAAGDPAEACATLERELASRDARDKVMERFRAFGGRADLLRPLGMVRAAQVPLPRLLDAADDLRRGSPPS